MICNLTAARFQLSSKHILLHILLLYLPFQQVFSQIEPFSQVVISYDVSPKSNLMTPASQYWEVTKSNQLNFEFPFYWQYANFRIQTSEFSGRTIDGSATPDFKEHYIALGWVARWQPIESMGIQIGLSLGDHSMVFSNEEIMGLKNENEFGVGIEGLIYVKLYQGIRLQSSYSKNMVFTSGRFQHESILIGLGYELNTPRFLMSFLK